MRVMDPGYCMIMTTCSDAAAAAGIVDALIAERLAACIQTMPVGSTYRWKGEVAREQETLLMIKTTSARYAAVEARIRALHPYEVPEILQVPVTAGFAPYLRWVDASVAGGAG